MPTITPEIINGMEAGKALDALVAQRVMGLTPCPHWAYSSMMRVQASWMKTADCPHASDECFWAKHPAEYSRNIAAAWIIVDHLRQTGWRTSLFSHYSHGPDRPFEWGCNFVNGIERNVVSYGPAAPLAICRSSLLTTL